jgi:hypothetical protein
MKRLASDKHYSLSRKFVNYNRKSLVASDTGEKYLHFATLRKAFHFISHSKVSQTIKTLSLAIFGAVTKRQIT